MLTNVVSLASDQSLSDDTIISRVLLGKTEEYEILVRRYNNMLYKTARGILSKEADIEDAMQEAYIRAFEKLHQFRKEARFSTWLTRILINCALQQVNKLKKEPLRLDELHEDEVGSLELTNEEPSEVGENLKKALESAIDQLPAKYRIVFMLREIEHKSTAETSALLDISEENVKIRLHRSKEMLKNILQSELRSLEVFEFLAPRCILMAERVMEQIRRNLLLRN
ncbi:MAG TPA: sigma-70 family RNA polymerase sigma factor [Cyclobacteriaceae bacterium]|nr:sigma-70 family RNA polymerase sigma factor [Cyclobacteriaceae bacterium]